MLNIYEIEYSDGEMEWITGFTIIHALLHYINKTNCDLHDMEDADIRELPQRKWSKYFVNLNDEGDRQTFKDWMKENGEEPDIICGTFYT